MLGHSSFPKLQSRALTYIRLSIALFVTLAFSLQCRGDWPQWGGPQRDFKVSGVKLAKTWASAGPRQVWRRHLGDGYSSIVTADERLFTMYRRDNQEHVVAMEAKTGKTIWQHSYKVQFLDGTNVEEFGPGPLSTPLIVENRIFTVGVSGVLHCLELDSGTVIWQRRLLRDLMGTNLFRGYSASPIAYQDTVILPVGGPGRGLVAFRIKDGSIAWQKHNFRISHVSPIMIRIGNEDQLVVLAEKVIVGVDPATGRLLWQHPHPIAGGYVSSTPVWDDDGRLFFSGAYGAGSRCLRLARNSNKTVVEEIWHNRRMRVHHSNVIRIGDVVYGSSGDFSAVVVTALDLKTGNVLWQQRQLGRASCVYADGRFIVLQEDGTLMLVTMTPKDMTIHSKVKLFDGRAWTSPTLDRKRLYIRNRKEIMSFQLP